MENLFKNENANAFDVYGKSKIALAKYTYHIAKKYENSNVKIYMNHPGITITPLGLYAFGGFIFKMAKYFSALFISNEKAALSVFYILSHNLEPGSIAGPDRLFGGWGYPKKNKILNKVKTGALPLIETTRKEIEGCTL